MICVDASVVVKQVAGPAETEVHRQWDAWGEGKVSLSAPALLLYEVTNVLYRMQRHGVLTAAATNAALAAATALPVRYVADTRLHKEALDAARRFDLPAAYDAHYVAVAEREGGTLVTADRRLLEALRQQGALFVRGVEPPLNS